MATTLRSESFADVNILELTALTADSTAGATTITVKSTSGFTVGLTIYVGTLAQDGCELATVKTVTSATALELDTALTLPHAKFTQVTGVVGDKVRIYRAANVDGTAPADDDFTVLATRQIDPDQQSTYYSDATGSSDYWYKLTYYNADTLDETDLAASTPVRGDDFGHYASLSEIREEAGFKNAYNLADQSVAQQRLAAETEINTVLTNVYTLPFSTVPAAVRVITIKLAAGLLLLSVYGNDDPKGKTLRNEARAMLANLKSGTDDLPEGEASALLVDEPTSWPNDSTADLPRGEGRSRRAFTVEDVY